MATLVNDDTETDGCGIAVCLAYTHARTHEHMHLTRSHSTGLMRTSKRLHTHTHILEGAVESEHAWALHKLYVSGSTHTHKHNGASPMQAGTHAYCVNYTAPLRMKVQTYTDKGAGILSVVIVPGKPTHTRAHTQTSSALTPLLYTFRGYKRNKS